ncbi:MAG: DUF3025 domain-containing protein [Hylemonella sp.]|nr:DUF3025 domain-containing protein [Hylemonella sp.]MDH5707643.1 DUF3025 domain-containing protein [Hylemonella sp.]
MSESLAGIDWAAPWLAPYREVGEPLASQALGGRSCAEVLTAADAAPVRFVPQQALPAGMAYEQFIFSTGQVPTRDGLHDFFNALCWMRMPQTKLRLNRLQAAQIAADGVQPVRGAVRDAITVFDENAALLRAPDDLWQALVTKDWGRLFGELRPLWAQSWLLLFGHALLEKLVQPRKAITAHVYRVQPQDDSLASLDAWLAQELGTERLAAKPFAHLPVLGVPGWWTDNEAPAFYTDAQVFRAPRRATQSV